MGDEYLGKTPISFDLTGVPAAINSKQMSAPGHFLFQIDQDSPTVVLPDGRIVVRRETDDTHLFCDATAMVYAQMNNGIFFPEHGEFRFTDFIRALKLVTASDFYEPNDVGKDFKQFAANPDSWKELEKEAGIMQVVQPSHYTAEAYLGHDYILSSGLQTSIYHGNLVLAFSTGFGVNDLAIAGRAIVHKGENIPAREAEYIDEYLDTVKANIKKRREEIGMCLKFKVKQTNERYHSLELCLVSDERNLDFSTTEVRASEPKKKSYMAASSAEMIEVWKQMKHEMDWIQTSLGEERKNRLPSHIAKILLSQSWVGSYFFDGKIY